MNDTIDHPSLPPLELLALCILCNNNASTCVCVLVRASETRKSYLQRRFYCI